MSEGGSEPERAEVDALRARVAELEATQASYKQHHRVRSFFSALLIVIAAVLAPLSAVAVWTSSQVTDTSRFVSTMAPLASNAAVQDAVANRVTDAVVEKLDIPAAVADLPSTGRPLVDQLLGKAGGAITNGVTGFVHTVVLKFVQSDEFQTVWNGVMRDAHAAMVKALTGKGDGAVKLTNDAVTIDLAPVIDRAKTRLVDAGLGVAANIPDVHTSFTVVESKDIAKLKTGFRVLDLLGTWMPVITVVIAAGGVLLATRRRRALVTAALAIAAGVAVLAIGLAIFRAIYLDKLPADVSQPAASAVYDTLVRYLRASIRMVITLGIIVALGTWLSGPGKWARKVRTAWQSGIAGARTATGAHLGPVGPWVHRYKKWLVWAVVAGAAIALVLWSYPTGVVILGITLTVVVALAIVEFLDDDSAPRGKVAGGASPA
ncbi:hypothetical protein [Yinghuangia seranimata]|uniref:hypothetical protein n=1 Tax=Yinghuangia seranimata TaxID=408067 RepID=UPI00248BE325|nr:hypothetical protein [Yinghuangia seranimata]MDI2130842.1 hypothetical protein [Yinghuangia seranimata]